MSDISTRGRKWISCINLDKFRFADNAYNQKKPIEAGLSAQEKNKHVRIKHCI